MIENLIKELNPQQKEAVTYFDSPLLILAGAGSGKTRVITYKIAYMIEKFNYEPERILAVTFTNKAAHEMKERVGQLLKGKADVFVSTFHSFCVKLLKSHSVRIGFKPNFLIIDTDDKKSVLKEILKELNLDTELYNPSLIGSMISNVKNGMVSIENFELKGYDRVIEIFELYNKKLKEMNAFDFDDLLLYGKKLLTEHEDIKNRYVDYFRYVLIDEYQDTNAIQYEITKALTLEKGNVCVVGDEDQCIYTWRGANINNILNFEKDFPHAKVVKLEKNYRCSGVILSAANAVIANNTIRKGKKLFTDNEDGEPIRLFEASTDQEEALFVGKTVKKLINTGFKPSEIAIFYRTNSQSRIVEDALRREGINYQIVGGLKFYERKEIKDIIAYMRVILFEEDKLSLFRILNVPKRGLGQAAEERLKKLLDEGYSNIEALNRIVLESPLRQREGFKEILEIIEAGKEKLETLKPYEFIKFITAISRYEDYLRKEYREDWETRVENITELGNTLEEFAERSGLSGEELYLEFLNTVTLSSDQDEMEDGEKVTLMTIHASKGLEFPVVFITGLEEGLFPHARSLDANEQIEEERRLFYVAITRAKKVLVLSYARSRRFFGSYRPTEKSRFIDEIPSHLIKPVSRKTSGEKTQASSVSSISSRSSIKKKPKIVFHKKFGKGIVKRVEGAGDTAKVTAYFANFGEKTIVMKFLKVLA
ncbi:ATP-dependent helicase [Desulfurobacterium atlanticum]|uniref:DNA 3'-5' helicase n=1 Tax=Desulfurobacterium atlanticum TaxID=240169 RepID=A0A238Y3Y7_9BACT|nr:UvrD-helicase domain-containing protein [Desulfurobacterium atlanticum]SNR65501.1 DNA helicase-2 / ATP-dependent DNA helicase PcrA [Desulfurobacterium atlanticum]